MYNDLNLQPLPLRDEAQSGYEKAAWKPNWKCFCCHDNGIIPERIVKTVMPNFVSGRHKPVKCNNCNIQLGRDFYETNTLDLRFTAQICNRLDQDERQMWREWAMQQHEKRKYNLDLSNVTNNLRARKRLNSEQFEVQQRHNKIIGK